VLAPIALFVYNRPLHTSQTLDALKRNVLAGSSDLIVFSDGPKRAEDRDKVFEVRKQFAKLNGFRSVRVIERAENYGLARSIIEGVTAVINEYGKIIVLEDDLVTSPYFLTFMNRALETYEAQSSVWHISGWNYPLNPDGLDDAFFWRTMNCWGWATWSDRWRHYRKEPAVLVQTWTKTEIARFNLDDTYDFWEQVIRNHKGELNSWAIFWYATIFKNNGLCFNPVQSLIINIGLDGSGQNCGISDTYDIPTFPNRPIRKYIEELEESNLAVTKIKDFFYKTKKSRLQCALRLITNPVLVVRNLLNKL
jgi:hypothetical protein